MSKPTSTIDSFLCHKSGTGNTYDVLVPIKDYPDLGSEPEGIDVTTLSDRKRKQIKGLQDVDTLTFTCNFDKDDYTKIKNLGDDEVDLAVVFGASAENTPDGHDGIFTLKGMVDVYVTGSGVNDPREMSVSVTVTDGPDIAQSLTFA